MTNIHCNFWSIIFNKPNKRSLFYAVPFIPPYVILVVASIRCDEYGFDCNYVTMGEIEGVVFDYWKHMNDSHGIDYSKGTIGKFATKTSKCKSKIINCWQLNSLETVRNTYHLRVLVSALNSFLMHWSVFWFSWYVVNLLCVRSLFSITLKYKLAPRLFFL